MDNTITILDLKDHIDKLVEEGKGGCYVRAMYDGMIKDIESPDQIIRQVNKDGKGVISGKIRKGEFLIES